MIRSRGECKNVIQNSTSINKETNLANTVQIERLKRNRSEEGRQIELRRHGCERRWKLSIIVIIFLLS